MEPVPSAGRIPSGAKELLLITLLQTREFNQYTQGQEGKKETLQDSTKVISVAFLQTFGPQKTLTSTGSEPQSLSFLTPNAKLIIYY